MVGEGMTNTWAWGTSDARCGEHTALVGQCCAGHSGQSSESAWTVPANTGAASKTADGAVSTPASWAHETLPFASLGTSRSTKMAASTVTPTGTLASTRSHHVPCMVGNIPRGRVYPYQTVRN